MSAARANPRRWRGQLKVAFEQHEAEARRWRATPVATQTAPRRVWVEGGYGRLRKSSPANIVAPLNKLEASVRK